MNAIVRPNVPEVIGTPFGGGFYSGDFLLRGKLFALISAPKAEGEFKLQWKRHNTATLGARSMRDGLANTEAMLDGDHPAAERCRALRIGGLDDWHLPSRYEAGLQAENLMPGAGYVPEQTIAEAFREGGPEAFEQAWYWTSTEFSPGYAWVQNFNHGNLYNGDKDWSALVRAVRKVPL